MFLCKQFCDISELFLANQITTPDAIMLSVLLIAVTWYQTEFIDWVPLHMETFRFLILLAGARFRHKLVLNNVPERTFAQAISQDRTPEEFEELHEEAYRLSSEVANELQGKVPQSSKRLTPPFLPLEDPLRLAKRFEIGVSLLRYAVYLNQPDLVDVLCKLGADVNFLHFNNETALFYAVHKGPSHAGVARILASHGGEVDREILHEEESIQQLDTSMAQLHAGMHYSSQIERMTSRARSSAQRQTTRRPTGYGVESELSYGQNYSPYDSNSSYLANARARYAKQKASGFELNAGSSDRHEHPGRSNHYTPGHADENDLGDHGPPTWPHYNRPYARYQPPPIPTLPSALSIIPAPEAPTRTFSSSPVSWTY